MDEFLLAAEEPPLTRSQSPLSFELQFQQLDRTSKIGKLKQLILAWLDGLGKPNGYILPRLVQDARLINEDAQRSFLHRLKQKRRA